MGRAPKGDAGESLVEILIAVVILGVTIVLVMGGLATVTKASGVFRKQTDVGKVLASASERLVSPTVTYVNCATTTTAGYAAAVAPADADSSGVVISIDSVQYWNGQAFAAANSCQDAAALGFRQQLVTLKVRSADDGAFDYLAVIKRG